MARPPPKLLSATLDLYDDPLGCFTVRNGGALESFVLEGATLVPLLGAAQRDGLALGQPRQMMWMNSDADLEEVEGAWVTCPVWDPFSCSVFCVTHSGHAVVQLLPDGCSRIVAGSCEKSGAKEGVGAGAVFSSPSSLTTDGSGALYLLDSRHLWKLQLPSEWQQMEDGGALRNASAAAAAAAGSAAVQRPQLHEQERGLVASIIACAWTPRTNYSAVVYDPLGQALVLASKTAIYRLALTAGEGDDPQPVLLAGREEASAYVDGGGSQARFRWIVDILVDGTGSVIVLDIIRTRRSPDTVAVRRVAPDGAVTTLAADLEGALCFPSILPNGYLALCVDEQEMSPAPRRLLVLDLGLTPNACHAAGQPLQPPGPQPHSLPADLSGLLASAGQADGGSVDVVVEVGGRAFHAHRAVLAARSAYFRQRLDPGAGFGDAGAQRLSLPDACPEVFELVLRYMYTDSAGDIPGALLQPAAELADRLLLPGLCEEVGRHVLRGVCAESVVGLLLWAEQRSARFGGLLRGLKAWFREHREEVLQLPEPTQQLMSESTALAYELICGPGAKRQRFQ